MLIKWIQSYVLLDVVVNAKFTLITVCHMAHAYDCHSFCIWQQQQNKGNNLNLIISKDVSRYFFLSAAVDNFGSWLPVPNDGNLTLSKTTTAHNPIAWCIRKWNYNRNFRIKWRGQKRHKPLNEMKCCLWREEINMKSVLMNMNDSTQKHRRKKNEKLKNKKLKFVLLLFAYEI